MDCSNIEVNMVELIGFVMEAARIVFTISMVFIGFCLVKMVFFRLAPPPKTLHPPAPPQKEEGVYDLVYDEKVNTYFFTMIDNKGLEFEMYCRQWGGTVMTPCLLNGKEVPDATPLFMAAKRHQEFLRDMESANYDELAQAPDPLARERARWLNTRRGWVR